MRRNRIAISWIAWSTVVFGVGFFTDPEKAHRLATFMILGLLMLIWIDGGTTEKGGE